MTSNERVKVLRKELGLTLEKFGAPLGVSKVAISLIEKGTNNLTEQMLLAICRTYGASETWLRDGTGEMLPPVTRNERIADFMGELLKDEKPTFKKQLIEVLSELNEEEREALAAIAQKLANKKAVKIGKGYRISEEEVERLKRGERNE